MNFISMYFVFLFSAAKCKKKNFETGIFGFCGKKKNLRAPCAPLKMTVATSTNQRQHNKNNNKTTEMLMGSQLTIFFFLIFFYRPFLLIKESKLSKFERIASLQCGEIVHKSLSPKMGTKWKTKEWAKNDSNNQPFQAFFVPFLLIKTSRNRL